MSVKYTKEWQRLIGARQDGKFGPVTLSLSKKAAGLDEERPSLNRREWSLLESDLKLLSHTSFRPGLRSVVLRCADICPFPFRVFETLRTKKQQAIYVKRGASKTMNSRHLTGHAVDLVPRDDDGGFEWNNESRYRMLAEYMKESAEYIGFPLRSYGLELGWDWYHFEQRWGSKYVAK